ncbi:hypothetical protein F4778DRAFT_799089 [Xylariomycetidae sp. FL2044]|nr:hypothetical protein F4778DRAFT_799089 [Xylariomycetidae sp. FL2044]
MAEVQDHQEEVLDNATTYIEDLKRAYQRVSQGGKIHDPDDKEVYYGLIRFGEIKLAQELLCAAKRVSELEKVKNRWMSPKKGVNRDDYLAEFVKRATNQGIRICNKSDSKKHSM